EGAAREARASTRMRQGGGAFRVVERRRDEDESREDQGQGRETESEGGGDSEGVVDARSDVAVTRREQRRRAERPRHLGWAADHNSQVARTARSEEHTSELQSRE